jgi:glutaredoxin 3
MNIKIYTSPSCPMCKALEAYIESKGLEYELIDVSTNEEERDKLEILTLPQIEIEGERVFGFNKNDIDKLLEQYEANNKDKNS